MGLINRDNVIDAAGEIINVGLGFCTSKVLGDVINAALPAPIGIAQKAIRIAGELGVALVISVGLDAETKNLSNSVKATVHCVSEIRKKKKAKKLEKEMVGA